MSLNQNFSGATLMRGRKKLDGPDRALDVLIGLVIIIVELLIGFLAVDALYQTAAALATTTASIAFFVALIGASIAFVITTIIYLVRISRGARGWAAPLWGLVLLSAATILGYLIMSSRAL